MYVYSYQRTKTPAEIPWYLMRFAVDSAGWSVGLHGGGTGSGVSGTGDVFGTVESWTDDNNAWFVLTEPAPGVRHYLYQRNTDDRAMRVYVSWTGFSGGTEDVRATAADEQQIIGTGGGYKSIFTDLYTSHTLQLFADTAAGGDYLEGTDSAVSHDGAVFLLGYACRPTYSTTDVLSETDIYGTFPLKVFRGTDEDPAVYLDHWNGRYTDSQDITGWFNKGEGSEQFVAGTLAKAYYWRESGGRTMPGALSGAINSEDQGKTTYGRIPIIRGVSTPQAFFKGVLQDVLWSYHAWSTALATHPSSITIPDWVKPNGTAAAQDFMRVGSDVFIPWDTALYPVNL